MVQATAGEQAIRKRRSHEKKRMRMFHTSRYSVFLFSSLDGSALTYCIFFSIPMIHDSRIGFSFSSWGRCPKLPVVDGLSTRPNFVSEGFMDPFQRSRHAYKLLFVYLHSPDHPDTPVFCQRTPGTEAFAAFVNENFVALGGSIRASGGFKMSHSFKTSRFPFCAVVMAPTNQRIALLLQIEGPKSPEEMLSRLQRVLEETAPVLVSARLEAEEKRNNMRLREGQDAAYMAALEADQAREQQMREQAKPDREHAEAEQKRREKEEARERKAREAAGREAALARRRQEKALSLGAEPEKGPDAKILVRFPTGERKDRRFNSSGTIQTIYDHADIFRLDQH